MKNSGIIIAGYNPFISERKNYFYEKKHIGIIGGYYGGGVSRLRL